jgi:hypothetical protein
MFTEYSPMFEKSEVEMLTLLNAVSRVMKVEPAPDPTVFVIASEYVIAPHSDREEDHAG